MKRILICCFALLCMISTGNAAICYSDEHCPNNVSVCMLNCSDRAVNLLNQPASHGNCQILITSDGPSYQSCFFDECNSTLCLPKVYGQVGVHCCCTQNLCNNEFDILSEAPPPSDLPDGDANATESNNNTQTYHHIYPYYPTHVTKDELVCVYQNCLDGDCSLNYEVCLENPIYNTTDAINERQICHAVFLINLIDGSQSVSKRCFEDPHSNCSTECVPKLHGSFGSGDEALFDCCCVEDSLCNAISFNFTGSPSSSTVTSITLSTINGTVIIPTSAPGSGNDSNDNRNLPVIYGAVTGVSLLVLLVLIVIVVLFYCYYLERSKDNRNQIDQLPTELMNSPISLAPVEGIDSIELIKQVGHGRFAAVWKAVMNNSSVAVKRFPVFNVESYNHERDIYMTPFFEHDCLLHFIGAEQRTVDYETQYWLLTAYHEYGSLTDFLRLRTITLENLYVMSESIAMGLAHLHSTFTRDGRYKPAIVHRDFKSKNILVKDDLTCAISDFGLAFKFLSGESPMEAQGQVGTTRYMSPEVLEGAVNFQREAFMRIDMYACGLVLWELTSRCIVDGTNPGEYMQPFEDELKGNPSIEMMKQVVIAAKKRPEFPIVFNVNPQLESLMTTITECWDDDAEARLSAKTVEERIKGLHRDICKPPMIDNEKDVGLMVALTPSQSMPVFPGKELSSGISCSLPNSYSTLTSPRSNISLTFSPKLADRNQNNVFPETSSPTRLTNGYMNIADCYPVENGHTPHPQLINSNGSSNKNHKAIPVHNKGLPNGVNGHIHSSFSETTL